MLGDPFRPPVELAIDTSLLMLLLGYQCLLLENARPLERTRVLDDIRGRPDPITPDIYDELWTLFQGAAHRVVTQHIVAEAYGNRRRLASFRHRRDLVWRGALMLLNDPGIEEHSCGIRDMNEKPEYRDILRELGPADAGLIYMAESRKSTIVTDDGQLVHWAGVRSVRAVLLKQIGR